MTRQLVLYAGVMLIMGWGIFHIIPTHRVVLLYGSISREKKLILVMEWIAEGITLCFIGVIVLMVTLLTDSPTIVSLAVYRASAGMLVVMAIVTLATGARTSIIPIKMCPLVKTTVAALFFLGSIL